MKEYLLALIADQLAGANWQRGGGKGPKPKPLPRPGDEQRERPRRISRVAAKRSMTLDEMRDLQRQWAGGTRRKSKRKQRTQRIR